MLKYLVRQSTVGALVISVAIASAHASLSTERRAELMPPAPFVICPQDPKLRKLLISNSILLTAAFLRHDTGTVRALLSDSNEDVRFGIFPRTLNHEYRRFKKMRADAKVENVHCVQEYRVFCMDLTWWFHVNKKEWVDPGRYASNHAAVVELTVAGTRYRQIWLQDTDTKWRSMFLPLEIDDHTRAGFMANLKKSGAIR